MREMENKRNKLILLMLLLPLVTVLIAAGCQKKNDGLYQFLVTSATSSETSADDTTMPSESITETETETETTATETEPTEETTESETETEETTPAPTKKPTPKPTVKPTPKPTTKTKAPIKSKTTKKAAVTKAKYSEYLFVGDSRTVGLGEAVSGVSTIAKVGAKVDYLKSVLSKVTKTRKKNVIFNFGVNDLGNINKYIKVYKSLPKDFIKNNNVVIMSVNPTDGSKYNSWNKDINKFNSTMKKNLPKGVKYLDTNSELKSTGFKTRDGVHYVADTYRKIAKLTFEFCGDKTRKP